ncbi:snoRNA-binding rRNA-processing protein [Halocaridina rubra]|uniref:U3 small nucleolar RNA-associated protein 15 homolog n=1 Tax=Halocaridina rubra TaxID=373956 RepID=A0AAN8WYA3_HALRR
MTTFKKIETRAFSKGNVKSTTDAAYWRKLEFPVTIREFTSIDYIDICPVEPHYIAVTSGPKVDIYHQQTAQVWRTLTRFKRLAYGAKFRQDGQLLLVGSEEGAVKLFNHRQKQMLRLYKGHTGPTHRVDFVHGSPQIVTFSDDKNSILWDMSEEKQICILNGHTDFIRAGMVSPASEHLIFTGSYDHSVRLWDTRSGSSVLTVDHGAPVESIACFPSGGVFVSAGGNEVRVWETIGGKLLSKFSQHHKTITCLAFASGTKRLFSGSLDRHVKIYDVSTYSVVHSLDFPAPILAMALAPEDSTLAVGMISSGSGLISFQHRRPDVVEKTSSKEKSKRYSSAITEDSFMRPEDHVIQPDVRKAMSKYDTHLQKYEYSKALDAVLLPLIVRTRPQVTVNVLKELIKRKGLKTAVAGRDAKELSRLVEFVKKHLRHPVYKHALMDVTNILIDVYEDSLQDNPGIVNLFRKLKDEVRVEMELTREHMALMGVLQMFMTVSDTEKERTSSNIPTPSTQVQVENPMSASSIKPTRMDVVNVS